VKDLTDSYDEIIRVTPADMVDMGKVDEVIKQALFAHDVSVAVKWLGALRVNMHLSALATAKFVYELKTRWDKKETIGGFAQDIADFDDAISAEIGKSVTLIRQYYDIWKYVLLEHRGMCHHPVDTLKLVASAAKQQEIDEKGWEELEYAPNKKTVREIIKRLRKSAAPRKERLSILLERNGQVRISRGGGPYRGVGVWDIKSDDPDAVAALERTCRGAGWVRR